MAKKEAQLSKVALFFFGAWLLAKFLKNRDLTVYKCWNCGYTLAQKGISDCPNCDVSLYWGNPTNEKSARKVKPSISPMIAFIVFIATGLVLISCLFIGTKSPEALEGIKVICYTSFGYSCGRR